MRKRMSNTGRRWMSGLLAFTLCTVLLAGCGDGKAPQEKDNKTETEKTEASTPVPDEDTQTKPADFSKSAVDFVKDMGVGLNLGNRLDAYKDGKGNETAWGNPYITKELIQAVQDAGFRTIRIPVTYMGQIGAAPDYTLDEKWLDRVQVVVDVALETGMYVIINIHHDGNNDMENGAWIDISQPDQTQMQEKFKAVWTQIAEKFKGYDEHLIFESMNEIMEKDNYGNPKEDATYKNINALNQIFVDAVRASGENNAERYLLVPGYNTNITATLLEDFILPTDTAEDKMMASVHFYDPWNFAGAGNTIGWGKDAENYDLWVDGWGQEDWVDEAFGKMKEAFTDKGVPIILGEYGAVYQSEEREDNRYYYIHYVTKAALDAGMCPVVWDNGGTGSGGDAFAIFSRKSGNVVIHEKYLQGIMDAAKGQ